MKTKEKVEQGKGTTDHLMPLGYLFPFSRCRYRRRCRRHHRRRRRRRCRIAVKTLESISSIMLRWKLYYFLSNFSAQNEKLISFIQNRSTEEEEEEFGWQFENYEVRGLDIREDGMSIWVFCTGLLI